MTASVKAIGLALAFLISTGSASAIDLRMKFEQGQKRTMSIQMDLHGNLDVEGDARIVGTTQGKGSVKIGSEVTAVDDQGTGTLENRLHGFTIDLSSEVDMGDGKKTYGIEANENGGKMVVDGQEEEIPAASLEDARAKTWTLRMDPRGAPAAMDLGSADLSPEEAAEVKQISDSITGLLGANSLLPENPVEVGDSWNQELKIADLTKDIAQDNPMLSMLANLGIPDVVTKTSLTEVRQEEGNEMGTLSSTTNFDWKEGNLPLGFLNVTINQLAFKSESLTEVDNTQGYSPRVTGVTTIDYDVVVNVPFGESGPQSFKAKGQLHIDSTIVTE